MTACFGTDSGLFDNGPTRARSFGLTAATVSGSGDVFCWNSTPLRVHLTPNILQTAHYIPDFSQLVLILGSRLHE